MAGDTQVSLSATAPTGGTAPYTYQWHQSTTSGFTPSGGTAIAGATGLTHTATGLTNGTAYYFKLVATDSATPTPASVTYTERSATPGSYAAADIASTDFETYPATITNTTSPFSYPWYNAATDTRATVINDPTGLRGGKVHQMAYPAAGATRALKGTFPTSGLGPISLGGVVYAKGYVYIPNGNLSSLRKLFYFFDNTGNTNTFFVVVGTENGNLYVELRSNGTSSVRVPISPTIPVSYDTWHYMEVKVQLNSTTSTADGTVTVWLDDPVTAAVASAGYVLMSSAVNLSYVNIGDQLQGTGMVDENRLWDDMELSTQRIGP